MKPMTFVIEMMRLQSETRSRIRLNAVFSETSIVNKVRFRCRYLEEFGIQCESLLNHTWLYFDLSHVTT